MCCQLMVAFLPAELAVLPACSHLHISLYIRLFTSHQRVFSLIKCCKIPCIHSFFVDVAGKCNIYFLVQVAGRKATLFLKYFFHNSSCGVCPWRQSCDPLAGRKASSYIALLLLLPFRNAHFIGIGW